MSAGEEGAVLRGALLEREAAALRLKVPEALKGLEPELQRLSARIRACGAEDPFLGDRLRALAPSVVRAAVEEGRKAGLVSEGPGWTLRLDQVQVLAGGVERSFQRHLDLDRELPGGRGL